MIKDGKACIGIDGGGTSCRAAMVCGEARFEATSGAANVSSDFDGAIRVIRSLLENLMGQAGLQPRDLQDAALHIGLAGVMSDAMGQAVAQALGLPQATITDDQPTTIAGALGPADGTVVAIGTGSFIGRQVAGKITRIGGWGFQIGDQASGAWLGRRLLEHVLLVQDGIAPASDLARQTAATDFGSGGIVGFSLRATPGDYARFAPLVLAAAQNDDSFAAGLMQQGAAYIVAGTTALGWQAGEGLCLTGGLGPAYARWIDHPVMPPLGSALDGALVLAGRS
jgi:glucosamine kinase